VNRVQTILAITIAAAALIGWRIIERTDQNIAPLSQSTEQQLSQSTRDAVVSTRSASQTSSTGEETPAERPVWYVQNDQHQCVPTTTFTPDSRTGELIEATGCDPIQEVDVYDSLDSDTLASLAYGDSHAAGTLGLRLIVSENPQEERFGLGLLYRSAALSADAEIFRKAIGTRYAYLSENGKPIVRNLEQMLVFSVIGETLGDKRFDSRRLERALRKADVDQQEIDTVRSNARLILQRMAELQTEVTGDMSIGEAIENA